MAWPTPHTWVAGAIVTAAKLNEQLRDALNVLGGPWDPYIPTLGASTAPTLNNSSLQGHRRIVGKTVDYHIQLIIGSTFDVGSGTYRFDVPSGTPFFDSPYEHMGRGTVTDASGSLQKAVTVYYVAATNKFSLMETNGTAVAHDSPWTWGTGDLLSFGGRYEMA